MERFFIIVVEKLGVNNCPSLLEKEFTLMKNYQGIFLKYFEKMNSASHLLPLNPLSIEWAVCIEQGRIVIRGSGPEEYQGLTSSTFTADLPSEPWDNNCFSQIKNKAVDIFIAMEQCPSFWNSIDPSNAIKVHQLNQNYTFNPQLFWRGTLKMSNPQTPTNFGHLENAEISYNFDELDIMLSHHIKGEAPNILPLNSFQKQECKIFSQFIELVGAFHSHTIPTIFYSSTSLSLTVEAAETFWNTLDENVSLLFRLDYTPDVGDNLSKDLLGTQCVYLLSHWNNRQLKVFVLKNADHLQNLANVFTRSATIVHPFSNVNDTIDTSATILRLDEIEVKTRRLQLLALQAWIEENGPPDRSTLDALLSEISLSVFKDQQHHLSCDPLLPTSQLHCPEYNEGSLLKWKLREIEKKNDKNCHNRLLQSSGRVINVDIPHLLRCFGRQRTSIIRSPSKNTTNIKVQSRLKPTCDAESARSTNWPQSALLKHHGINYNLSVEDEKTERQETEYQNKWVPSEAESASWCNPWAINSYSTYQLSNARKTRIQQPALISEARTPKKQQSDLSQLRKSPRLLAKNTRPSTRRTPSKKNPTRVGSGAETSLITNKDFKQQLKAVIIRVLADQKISTQDTLFRTCANKLSVICMALLKDSKATVTPRQMYQVAKSQAKQVLQFVKP